MLSGYRDIAVFCDASVEGKRVMHHAAVLALRFKAHLIGVYGVAQPEYRSAEGYVRGSAAINQVIQRRRQEEERKVLEAGHEFAETTRQYNTSSEFRVFWRESVDDDSVSRTLHCDLIVAPDGWSAERLLLSTGTPVLLVPSGWDNREIGSSVLVGWNRSREARRAVNDALPFLSSAARTTLLIVDTVGDPQHADGEQGMNMREHLQRHDIAADLMHVRSDGQPVGEVILAQAGHLNADLLVFGAYSRPRTAEVLFGGTTRSLLGKAQIPMLISR